MEKDNKVYLVDEYGNHKMRSYSVAEIKSWVTGNRDGGLFLITLRHKDLADMYIGVVDPDAEGKHKDVGCLTSALAGCAVYGRMAILRCYGAYPDWCSDNDPIYLNKICRETMKSLKDGKAVLYV